MSHPFQITFTLKQHTPIIHFQHSQEGATLRASEVKPKLDRFLIRKCKEANPPINFQKWLSVNNDKEALNYKFRVLSSNKEDIAARLEFEEKHREIDPDKKYVVRKTAANLPMILANMAGKPSPQDLKDIRKYETLDCQIFVLDQELKNLIENNIIEFFSITNFGNRSNKGFGSFSLMNLNGRNVAWDQSILPTGTHYLRIPSVKINDVYNTIDYFYKWMKSGINYSYYSYSEKCNSGRYLKSVLFEYLESLYPITGVKYNWEKRWMKENYLSLPPLTPPNYQPKFYRALLGLADKHTFTKAQCHKDSERVSNFQLNMGKLELNNVNVSCDIDRIASPLVFKVITTERLTMVYILIEDGHIDEIYSTGISKQFIFFKESKLDLSYRIRDNNYDIVFKHPENDLRELDFHLARIRPHLAIPALKEKYDIIEKFIQSFSIIELPLNKINYYGLLTYFKGKYPVFKAKDFRWRDITTNNTTVDII